MSDAKELVERLRKFAYARKAYDIQFTIETEAAAWIERWAPVVDALTEVERLRQTYEHWEARGGRDFGPSPNRYQDRYMAKKRLRFALNAALGEDKP